MPMTYDESAALMQDPAFRGRCKVACLKYADNLLSPGKPQPVGNTLTRWAQRTFQMPDTVAGEVQPPTVMDAAVQLYGALIPDDNLQGSVEAVVNKMAT